MGEQFAISEIAIALSDHPAYNGAEVEIIGIPQAAEYFVQRAGRFGFVQPGLYLISHNGGIYKIQPERLRKKRPPRDDLRIVRWADCPWTPHLERV